MDDRVPCLSRLPSKTTYSKADKLRKISQFETQISLKMTRDVTTNNLKLSKTDDVIDNWIKKTSLSQQPPDITLLSDIIPQSIIIKNTQKISSSSIQSLSENNFERKPAVAECVDNNYLLDLAARLQYGEEKGFKSRLQQYFLVNYKSALRIRTFNFLIKVLSCILYCVRVLNDEGTLTEHLTNSTHSDYHNLFWVDRSHSLWIIQTIVAVFSIFNTIIHFIITYKGSIVRLLFNIHFILELVTSFPLVVSVFLTTGREIYVPIFLNCWLANGILNAILNDINRASSVKHSAVSRQYLILFSTLICLVFTGTCCIEHLQRAGKNKIDLFTSFYFIIVTFSTVGYGDVIVDTKISRLLVVSLIIAAIIIIPSKVETLAQTYMEQKRAGVDCTQGFAKGDNHVVVTITHFEADFLNNFLTEFYAHREHQGFIVVLLSPAELDNKTKLLLKIPLWSQRVVYIRGSALKDEDLERAKMSTAVACFILSARHINKKIYTDEHTILRSWAVKDFAPHVSQYVHVFRPETKLHIEHAEVIICEDEFKYSLLGNNAIIPGLSTFITLLLHTSRGEEGQKSLEPWHKIFGFHSGNEIYDIRIGDSRFFGDYIGKTFVYASFYAHKNFGVCLIAVESCDGEIKLNPGNKHILDIDDRVFYIALTNEESLSNFKKDINKQRKNMNKTLSIVQAKNLADKETAVKETEDNQQKARIKRTILQKAKAITTFKSDTPRNDNGNNNEKGMPTIDQVTGFNESSSEEEDSSDESDSNEIIKTYPPVTVYIGTAPVVCHMLKKQRAICCLQIAEPCSHCNYKTASEYNFPSQAIIVAVDKTSSGLYNLIIPLRAYYRPVEELHPIILLLELKDSETPNPAFLDSISWFPMIYWMHGKISNLENLLKAGVCNANSIIVIKEGYTDVEEHLADCSTIITVQKIHRMFPTLRVITELTHASNMRFMQFDAYDSYALQQSKFEKREKKHGSQMPFMFRLPFAQGNVFSANMLDRLLYQALVKKYLVKFTRLLLGIEQTSGSGYLTSFKINKDDLWIGTYGRLFQKLCSSCADIPIGIYRTKKMDSKTISLEMEKIKYEEYLKKNEFYRNNFYKDNLSKVVTEGMRHLGMVCDEYECKYEDKDKLSYVIINPCHDMEIEEGDLVYIIRAPVKESATSKKINPKRGLIRKQGHLSKETNVLSNYASQYNEVKDETH
uniref:C2H2-type domain-containing protein n=1 Tax=Parastrongyloides trichosuri TaxID=131310 RepID=A0A0N4ZT15_PARTI